jgi:hypothetical protein
MASKDNYNIIEVQPTDHILPTFDLWGTELTIPTSSLNTALLVLLCILKIKETVETSKKGLKLALTALDRLDIAIIDAMDDLAVEIRETTNADRVLFFLLHNGISNPVYHWRRLSAMSESTRTGIKPVIKEMRDILVPSVATESDYVYYKNINAHKRFVHVHVDSSDISRKHKNFISDSGMFGHYVRVLVDDETNKPYGAVIVQYSTRGQCDKDWSTHTHQTVEQKLNTLYALLARRTNTPQYRFFAKIKEFIRFGK